MARTQKIFRDILCEGRAHPVETTDPTGARTIDELKKQVSKLKWELEAEKQRFRQLQRDHEKQLKQQREEHEKKLEVTTEVANVRKDQEKAVEIKRVEEKLLRQKDIELRNLEREKNEEIRQIQRRIERERDDSLRVSVEVERKRIYDEFQEMFPEEEMVARETKLTNEVFFLGEQNERLEDQVRSLTRENRSQIELLRRMKHEHEAEIASLIKQHQSEASRDMAQLRLSERMLAERNQELQTVEYRADMMLLEKEAMVEELAHLKSVSLHDTSLKESGGRHVEELDALVKRLEEERSVLKQENASLRKKVAHEGDGEGKVNKQTEEKLKKLRKRNAELVALAKQLDEKNKSLKNENEQLQKQAVSPAEAEHHVRKSLSRQHAKDIMEYTQQIHAKNKEIEALKKRIAKFEAGVHSRETGGRSHEGGERSHETSPKLEKMMKTMAMEKLHMEKMITKLVAKLPDAMEVEGVSRSEIERTQQLAEENELLRKQLEELKSSHQKDREGLESARREDVDYHPGGRAVEGTLPERQEEQTVGPLSEVVEALKRENASLKTQIERLAQFESEAVSLKASLADAQSNLGEVRSASDHQIKQLSQQLETAKVAIHELEGAQDHCSELEREVAEMRGTLNNKDTEICQLELEHQNMATSLKERDEDLETVRRRVLQLESTVSEKEQQCRELRVAVEELKPKSRPPPPPQVTEIGLQTEQLEFHRTEIVSVRHHSSGSGETGGRRRVKSPVHREASKMPIGNSRSGGELDVSLENEMRAAGIEVNDSFDSSEGVGFSETTLDDLLGSAQSLESFKSDQVGKEEENAEGRSLSTTKGASAGQPFSPATVTKWADVRSPDSRSLECPVRRQAPYAESEERAGINQLLKEQVSEPPAEGEHGDLGANPPVISLEELGEEEEEEDGSSDSDSDLPGLGSSRGNTDIPTQDGELITGVETLSPKVSIFVAKFTYKPAEMSPNPSYDQELAVTAGDYLYIYGDIDEDGFYHGQHQNGEIGLVPSNFVERVMDESDADIPSHPPRKGLARRRLSNLQDIEEEEEDVSSGDTILPPRNLELDRQFVEGTDYSVVIRWEPPQPLPPETSGYKVYVNGRFKAAVDGAKETNVILSGIPRQQLVKISVRTATEEGESPDPVKLVVLNPQYPEPPTDVAVSQTDNPRAILVEWTPPPALLTEGGTTITGYVVYVNNHLCLQLAANETPKQCVCAQVLAEDLRRLKLVQHQQASLTVRTLAGQYESMNSDSVMISKKMLTFVLESGKAGGRMLPEEGESESSHLSISSGEEEREVFIPARRALEDHVTQGEDHMIQVDHVTKVEDHVTNGTEFSSDGENKTACPPRYYRALFMYDPYYHSPNEEDADEELPFSEGDIILARSEIDEDGFFEGEVCGRVGLVPENMVEEITSPEELSQVPELLAAQAERKKELAPSTMNGGQTPTPPPNQTMVRHMKALNDYDPATDSPNSATDEELSFKEGDILTVYGKCGEDGYYEAELRGKKGFVPSNFLEKVLPDRKGRDGEGLDVFAADADSMRQAETLFNATDSLKSNDPPNRTSSPKHQNNFSQGEDLLSKRRKH